MNLFYIKSFVKKRNEEKPAEKIETMKKAFENSNPQSYTRTDLYVFQTGSRTQEEEIAVLTKSRT